MSRPAARIATPVGEAILRYIKHYRDVEGLPFKQAIVKARQRAMQEGSGLPLKGRVFEKPLAVREAIKPTGAEAIRAKGKQFLEKHPKLEKALPWAIGAAGAYGAQKAYGEEIGEGAKPPPWERIISSDAYRTATPEQQKTVQKNFLIKSGNYLVSQGIPNEGVRSVLTSMRDRMLKPYVSAEEMLAKEAGVEVLPTFQRESLPEQKTWEDVKWNAKSHVMKLGSDAVFLLNQAAKGGTWPVHGLEIPGLKELVDLPPGSEGNLGEFFKKTEEAIDDYRAAEGFPRMGEAARVVGEFAGMGGIFKHLHKLSGKVMTTPAMNKAFGKLATKIGGPKANIVKKATQEAMTMGFFESFHGPGWKEKLAFITGGAVLGGVGGKIAEMAVAKNLIKAKIDVGNILGRMYPGKALPSGLEVGEATAMEFYTGKKFVSGLTKEEVIGGTLNRMLSKELPVEADKEFISTILERNI